MSINKVFKISSIFVFIILMSCNNQSFKKKDIKNYNYNYNYNKDSLEETANKLYKDKEYLKAGSLYNKLLTIDSSNAEFYFKSGYCKSLNQDYIGAKNDYLKSIKLNYADKKKSYLNLGTLYRFFGIFDSAIYFYNQSLKLDSNFIKAKQEKSEVINILKMAK